MTPTRRTETTAVPIFSQRGHAAGDAQVPGRTDGGIIRVPGSGI